MTIAVPFLYSIGAVWQAETAYCESVTDSIGKLIPVVCGGGTMFA
jgi:hypothetical protein